MSIDDSTVKLSIKALTDVLKSVKGGEKKQLTEKEIKKLYK
ncbi:hypothetical protein [Mucilaginibacter sp. 44-25]|nr:hypothetical protein [Mucilaginibacter sp. 44-25]